MHNFSLFLLFSLFLAYHNKENLVIGKPLRNICCVIMTYDGAVVVALGAEIRLAGSNQPGEGRLEVYYNGVWGTVCNDSFDDIDASVACFQLGLG